MSLVLFEINGVLPDSKYLPGQHRFSYPVRVAKALLTCRPPVNGTLMLTLILTPPTGSDLAAGSFIVPVSMQAEITQEMSLNLTVPANTWMRWRAAFTDAPEQAAASASIAMQVVPSSGNAGYQPKLQVAWVNQSERLTLFNYDPVTHRFTETTPGISADRASIVNAGPDQSVMISIQGVAALRVANSTMYAQEFVAVGCGAVGPRLEFLVGAQRVASLTQDGTLRVPDIREVLAGGEMPDDVNRFEFYSAGALTATLDATGLTALNIGEPLP